MFAPKVTQSNRSNRLNSSVPKRSTTPQHTQTQAQHRNSQSQTKQIVQNSQSPGSLLPSILEQEQGQEF